MTKDTNKNINENKVTAWGTAGLVCGILGLILFLAPYIGLALSILAVIFYAIQKKHNPITRGTTALVLGIIGIVTNSVMLLLMAVVLSTGLVSL